MYVCVGACVSVYVAVFTHTYIDMCGSAQMHMYSHVYTAHAVESDARSTTGLHEVGLEAPLGLEPPSNLGPQAPLLMVEILHDLTTCGSVVYKAMQDFYC